MRTIHAPAEIVAAASAAYPDDYIAHYYDARRNRLNPDAHGDWLAGYLLAEILSACEDATANRAHNAAGDVPYEPETDPVTLAIRRLETAAEQVEGVIAALRNL